MLSGLTRSDFSIACLLKCSKLDFVDGAVFFAAIAASSDVREGVSGSGLPRAGEISRDSPPRDVGVAAVLWGCEDVNVDRMEAADVFLMGCLLVGGATGWWAWLGGPPMTFAAVVATGLEVTVIRTGAPVVVAR